MFLQYRCFLFRLADVDVTSFSCSSCSSSFYNTDMPPKQFSAFFQSPPTSVATNPPANTSQMPSILPGLGQYRIQLDQLAARRSSTISLATSTLTFPLSHPTFKQPSGKPPLPYLGCWALFATVSPIANRALLQEEYDRVRKAA